MSNNPDGRQSAGRPHLDVAGDSTPYQLTLAGLTASLRLQAALNIGLGAAFALVAGPLIALAWTIGLCVADQVQQRIYARWSRTAAATDTKTGLRRIGWLMVCKSAVWFSGPMAFTLIAQDPVGRAFVGVTSVILIALAASSARHSRVVFMAMTIPAAAALAISSVAIFGLVAASGLLVAIVVLVLVLMRVAYGANRVAADWNRASHRALASLAETKAALAETKAAEKRLRMAIEIANLYVYEIDYVGRSVSSVGSADAFFETPPTCDAILADPLHGVAAEDYDTVAKAFATARRNGRPFQAEYRVARTDGREVWASGTCELLSDDQGRPISLVGALQDITARKRGELDTIDALLRAEAANRAKSDFLTTISHEIRTPLNGVLGMAQAMEAGELPPVQRGRLEVIRRSGESLLVLLNSVLDLSKIEAGKMEMEQGEVDISDAARVALDAFSAAASAKGLELVLDITPRAEGVYAGDSARVTQVLYNLASNAVKFTDAGAVTLTVDRPMDVLVIQVADSGIGIPQDQRESLFEKFVQADASVTRRYGGSGLGLAISRELVECMGGAISLESEVGRGSIFTVTLPLAKLRAGAVEPTPRTADLQIVSEPLLLRVLAAEDNPVNQLVLNAILEPVGIVPVLVGDGEQAVAAWRKGQWDLILMDVQMPVMDGVTATRAIRAEEAALGRKRTPIIGVTANVMAHQLEAYHTAGMDAVVGKPIEFRRLLEVIEATLSADGAEPSIAA